jgi:hypothetical protein
LEGLRLAMPIDSNQERKVWDRVNRFVGKGGIQEYVPVSEPENSNCTLIYDCAALQKAARDPYEVNLQVRTDEKRPFGNVQPGLNVHQYRIKKKNAFPRRVKKHI